MTSDRRDDDTADYSAGDHPAYTGDYPDPEKIAAIQARRPCPKLCEGCDPASEHHWVDDSDSLTGFGCKHCEAIGIECLRCAGSGEAEEPVGYDEDEDDDAEASTCPACGGLCIVEVVRISRRDVEAMREDRAALLEACRSFVAWDECPDPTEADAAFLRLKIAKAIARTGPRE